MLGEQCTIQGLIGTPLTLLGHVIRFKATRSDGVCRFRRSRLDQKLNILAWHLNVQVDSIEEWPADFAHVPLNLIGGASAYRTLLPGLSGLSCVATRARIHRGNQLKPRGKLSPHGCARNGDTA